MRPDTVDAFVFDLRGMGVSDESRPPGLPTCGRFGLRWTDRRAQVRDRPPGAALAVTRFAEIDVVQAATRTFSA